MDATLVVVCAIVIVIVGRISTWFIEVHRLAVLMITRVDESWGQRANSHSKLPLI